MEIEAFLHDGVSGEVLAKNSFVREASGTVLLAPRLSIGSDEFYKTDLGRAWGALLDEIAAWTEAQAACLPFSARVVKVSGKQLHIDSGAESGLAVGNKLTLHGWKEPSILGMNGLLLGKERQFHASASIRSLYPRFSVIEVNELNELNELPAGVDIKPGDIIYAR